MENFNGNDKITQSQMDNDLYDCIAAMSKRDFLELYNYATGENWKFDDVDWNN